MSTKINKLYISSDIEGTNGINNWDETEYGTNRYYQFQNQMNKEVKAVTSGAIEKGIKDILVKDAHDSGRNLLHTELPKEVKLHRSWDGSPLSMMASIDESYDAVAFTGYHSPSKSDGNTLAHTMNTRIAHVKLNGEIVSEFLLNTYTASYYNVPILFLSGDEELTKIVNKLNPNIKTYATKVGTHGSTISKHPDIVTEELNQAIKQAIDSFDKEKNFVPLPPKFIVEVEYKLPIDAYRNSFYPGCKLINPTTISFTTKDYYEVLRMCKFTL